MLNQFSLTGINCTIH